MYIENRQISEREIQLAMGGRTLLSCVSKASGGGV